MRKLILVPTAFLLASATWPPTAPFSLAELLAKNWCGDASPLGDAPAEILEGYGGGGFTIRTGVPQAQAFFTNGMQLGHAFAHKASIKAFEEAARLDPDCAMCAWGVAWSGGPTINYGADDETRARLAETAARAQRLAEGAPALERDLTAALVLRYQGTAEQGNRAFAQAMDALTAKYPDNDTVWVLAADALMIAAPEDWNAQSMARPVALLETVLVRNPDYTPAIHFYIHATEGAGYPARAERYADRLATLAPAASHLVHMPSHTYYWIGRYREAASTNIQAVAIGEANAARLKIEGQDPAWQLTYYAHNVHYGLGGALMSGDAEAALSLARPAVAAAGRAGTLDPFRQIVLGEAFVAIARYAPREMLAVADPGTENSGARAMWRYARAEAYAALGDLDGVKREGRAIGKLAAGSYYDMGPPLAKLARTVIDGRIAMMRGKPDKAARAFAKATAIEEAAPLNKFVDPPIWWYPVRRDLASALLADGKPADALTAIEASLASRPNDPVALEVRGRIQQKLGKSAAATRDLKASRAGWAGSRALLKRLAYPLPVIPAKAGISRG